MTTEGNRGAVLVVGAGIAGMAAGMHLAEVGQRVYLLDAAPAIGGSMHLLDHTFPTDSCGICLMLPRQPAYCPTFECERAEGVVLLPNAELVGLEGRGAGRVGGLGQGFTATVRHKARYVDEGRCTGCGDCAVVCPEARPHDYEGWMAPGKAIYRPAGLRVVPDGWVIDMDYCTRCGACVAACGPGAIDLGMVDREEELEVGAVLLAPGFAPFDARVKGEYGYGVYDNVLTALEFERLVSLAGSTGARLVRPSDGSVPQKVGFVQCVGSRDPLCGAGHCSSACCMYTAKQVALAKKREPGLAVTVFHMDLRAFGKGFEAYLAEVQAMPGVRYRRAMPSAVHQEQRTRGLWVSYVGEDGRLAEERFDLLVLAVGFAPPAGMQGVARGLGVDLNEYGFAVTDGHHPARTTREGVFVAGAFREPKDIPETVVEAAGAAAEVAAFLRERGYGGLRPGRLVRGDAGRFEARDVSDEEPRVGVFVCQCNGEMEAVDVAEVAAWAAKLPGVAVAEVVPAGCTAAGQAAIRAGIEGEALNRVVVAGCSPRLFGAEFEGLMREVGLDPRLLARVNLREQVVYPHRDNGRGYAGESELRAKAQSLVGMAVAGLRSMAGVEALSVGERRGNGGGTAHHEGSGTAHHNGGGTPQELTRRAVVVGGGAAGMTAALLLARLGVPVELVEREAELGGQWRHLRYQADGSDPQAALEALIGQVGAEEGIRVHLGAELVEVTGGPGQYRSVIAADGYRDGGGTPHHEGDGPSSGLRVEHGVVVVATGGRPATTREYLYGQDPRVVTQRELEEQIAEGTLATVRRVVMVQCVGSREPGRPYCSRVCCTQAVKNALKLKALRPEVEVYVLYREVRTYGFREAYYQAAREAGVVFLRYGLPGEDTGAGALGKPEVTAEAKGLRVRLVEPVAGQPVEIEADLLVLSVGIDGGQGHLEEERALAAQLGVVWAEDGRGNATGRGYASFQEEQPKMKPLDLKSAAGAKSGGVFVAGLAHSSRFLEETLAQGAGAAMRAAAYLAPEVVEARATSVWVNERLCSFCGLCVEACPYGARVMNYETRVADVDYTACQGCGVCAMVCPNKATLQKAFEHRQLMAAIDMALM